MPETGASTGGRQGLNPSAGRTGDGRSERTGSAYVTVRHDLSERELEIIEPAPLTSIDLIDAALCALAAHDAAIGAPCHSYGEPLSGLIVVPLGSPA